MVLFWTNYILFVLHIKQNIWFDFYQIFSYLYIERQDKDDIKEEDGLNIKHEQDNTKEDSFAVQALASFGFGLGLTVHGSALVFPAVAVPRLKQVTSC